MDNDDETILSILLIHEIPSNISDNVLKIINICKKNNKFRYLSLEYITIATYVMFIYGMEFVPNILSNYIYMINDKDDDLKLRTLHRYCLYVMNIYKVC